MNLSYKLSTVSLTEKILDNKTISQTKNHFITSQVISSLKVSTFVSIDFPVNSHKK